MKIHILTYNGCPNSRAFNCPLLAAKPAFKKHQVSVTFFYKLKPSIFNSDVIFINSRFFKSYWQTDKSFIFKFLEDAAGHRQKIVWFDTTDSTWCTQFEVLPYVDLFLKGQILADKSCYLNNFRTGRVYTDFFDDLYNCQEAGESYPVPFADDLAKIDISWNTCFENYLESRFSFVNRLKQQLRPYSSNLLGGTLKIDFSPVDNQRSIEISSRVGLSHSRPSVIAHRQAINSILQERGVDCGKIPLADYFQELQHAQLGIGPFGVGEITLRDYEIIICGATLLKPAMDHLKTWPDLFQPDKTFIPFKWDLSDFSSILDKLLADKDYCREIAANAQSVYQHAVSEEGMELFVQRLLDKISSLNSPKEISSE